MRVPAPCFVLEQGHAARDAAERDLMRALTYRTEELESARKGLCRHLPPQCFEVFTHVRDRNVMVCMYAELNEAQETANAAKVEITMLSAALGFARKGNDLMQVRKRKLVRENDREHDEALNGRHRPVGRNAVLHQRKRVCTARLTSLLGYITGRSGVFEAPGPIGVGQ